jgi:hypothetical protein
MEATMSVEARKLLADGVGRKSVIDEGYLGALTNKWGEFLEGIPTRTDSDRYVRGCTAMLFENQSQYLQSLNEDTRSTQVGSFTKFIFPILRRVFPNLIANEIVSVQPMTAPVGAVFYLDYVYGKNKGQVVGGTTTFPDGFDKDYSGEFINGEPLATGDGSAYSGAGAALGVTLAWSPVRPLDSVRGFSLVIKEVDSSGNVIQTATDNGSGGFTGNTSAGAINYTTGAITGFKFSAIPALNNKINAYYFYNGEMNSQVPEIQLNVRQSPVEAIPRRLKALWSSEAAEDLRAFHGVDAETEMVAVVAQEIALEIDREIIQDLFKNATGTTATFDRSPPAGVNEVDHLRAMITQISTVSNLIHKKTLRAPANWIVTSPEVSALLAQLTTHGDFRPMWSNDTSSPYGSAELPRALNRQGQFGVYKVGTLMGKWTVYEDPFFTRDQMMIGLKGEGFLNAGYAWAPYIPLQVTPTFLDPADFSFRKGLRTRYAKKLLRSEFYGSMRINNL